MSECFTQEERAILKPYFSNLDQSVFVLTNLPEVVKGALFARYSRSDLPLRTLFLREFLGNPSLAIQSMTVHQVEQGVPLDEAVEKAEKFYDRVLHGFGHGSVGELGNAHLAIEGISNVGSGIIEGHRLISPLEKSTRYVDFSGKVDGEYQFFKEPRLMESNFAGDFVALMHLLFETYAEVLPGMREFIRRTIPLEGFVYEDPITGEKFLLSDVFGRKSSKRDAETVYGGAVNSKACDLTRGLLLAAALTNMGISANGRSFGGLLIDGYSSDYAEMRSLASLAHGELNHVIAPFLKGVYADTYRIERRNDTRRVVNDILKGIQPERTLDDVVLVSYDEDIETRIVAAILFPEADMPKQQLREIVEKMGVAEKYRIVDAYVGSRTSRFDSLRRAFEYSYLEVEVVAPFSVRRDLRRHRMLTQQDQPLGIGLGFYMPDEIKEAGFGDKWERCMDAAEKFYGQVVGQYPLEAQYGIPFAFNQRFSLWMNFREAALIAELRSGPQGDELYRRVAQKIYGLMEGISPLLTRVVNQVDMKEYPLGRLTADVAEELRRRKLKC